MYPILVLPLCLWQHHLQASCLRRGLSISPKRYRSTRRVGAGVRNVFQPKVSAMLCMHPRRISPSCTHTCSKANLSQQSTQTTYLGVSISKDLGCMAESSLQSFIKSTYNIRLHQKKHCHICTINHRKGIQGYSNNQHWTMQQLCGNHTNIWRRTSKESRKEQPGMFLGIMTPWPMLQGCRKIWDGRLCNRGGWRLE